MTRAIIDQRDALRRTVARQDDRIRELEAEVRRLRSADAHEHAKAQGVREYKEELGPRLRGVIKECPL